MSPATVGVRFRRAGKIYYFQARGLEDLGVNEHVVVDTSRGRELGWVVIAPGQLLDTGPDDLKPVTRRATDQDLNSPRRPPRPRARHVGHRPRTDPRARPADEGGVGRVQLRRHAADDLLRLGGDAGGLSGTGA